MLLPPQFMVVKGANGVVLINTRRGKEGKININAKVEGFASMPTKLPEFVDGYTYASMANEAKLARNEEPLYQPEELEVFRLGLDPGFISRCRTGWI